MTPSSTWSRFTGRIFALLILLPVACLSQAAKAVEPPLHFEVISIHPHAGVDDSSSRRILPGGRFVATGTSVRTLIRIAFGTDDSSIAGLPGWVRDQTFDMQGTIAGHMEPKTPEEYQQLILSLLEERFQLKFHRERKEGPVYWLEMTTPAKPGRRLKPAGPDSKPSMSTNSNGAKASLLATSMSMAELASALQRQVGRPVEDHTGLQGNFDFEMEWNVRDLPDSDTPSLFTVLQEELGLRLKPAKGTVEHIVVDQIELPSQN